MALTKKTISKTEISNLLTSFVSEAEISALADSNGNKIGKGERVELLEQLRAGKHIELFVTGVSYRQSTDPRPLDAKRKARANSKFVYFPRESLDSLARSFKKQPFQRDHDSDLLARGGTIVDSELIEIDRDWVGFSQTFRVVKPWAVEGFLDGTIEHFSIGIDPGEDIFKSMYCSACKVPFFSRDHDFHLPGSELKVDGKRVVVEIEWRGVSGRETSAVTFAAVKHTKVDEIGQALSSLSQNSSFEGKPMNEELLKLLGLSADASDDEIAKRIRGLKNERDELNTKLSQESDKLAKEQEAHTKTRAALASERKGRLSAMKEKAISEGKFCEGDEACKMFEELAAENIERGERYLGTLKPQGAAPVGGPKQSEQPASRRDKSERKLSEREKRYIEELELTEEEYFKLGFDEGDEIEDADEE